MYPDVVRKQEPGTVIGFVIERGVLALLGGRENRLRIDRPRAPQVAGTGDADRTAQFTFLVKSRGSEKHLVLAVLLHHIARTGRIAVISAGLVGERNDVVTFAPRAGRMIGLGRQGHIRSGRDAVGSGGTKLGAHVEHMPFRAVVHQPGRRSRFGIGASRFAEGQLQSVLLPMAQVAAGSQARQPPIFAGAVVMKVVDSLVLDHYGFACAVGIATVGPRPARHHHPFVIDRHPQNGLRTPVHVALGRPIFLLGGNAHNPDQHTACQKSFHFPNFKKRAVRPSLGIRPAHS